MLKIRTLALVAVVGLAGSSGALAQRSPTMETETPKIFTDVVECRKITDPDQRLACYDRTVGVLASAEETDQLYVADRESIREARRGLFGFNLPKLRIFKNDDMAEDVDSIETTIKSVRSGQRGYIFTLEDGAIWAQTDKSYMDRPKPGQKIRIRKAALGSFMARVENDPGFRIERLNN